MSSPIDQHILTFGTVDTEDSLRLVQDLKTLAQLQNQRYLTLFEALRGQGGLAEELAGEKADNELTAFLSTFAFNHRLDPAKTIHYFGGLLYPTPQSLAVFDADFKTAQGWELAATEPISSPEKRARIIPTAVTTAEAIGWLRQTHGHFESNGCRPIITELSEFHDDPITLRMESIGNLKIPVVSISPSNAMQHICQQLKIDDCLLSRTNITARHAPTTSCQPA